MGEIEELVDRNEREDRYRKKLAILRNQKLQKVERITIEQLQNLKNIKNKKAGAPRYINLYASKKRVWKGRKGEFEKEKLVDYFKVFDANRIFRKKKVNSYKVTKS
uniref:Uncharacterized protein n=1 Tax=Euplotes harpa TaxID=151035 RepID=A0A7S3N7D4_9SPIT|mmetsp:Transcript_30155/g.34515  ORF Transcript_30155/g.34515 Transcript_30155/m.34515 type:complete len:106 (+) Transcript_30155:103-420(+)